MEQPVIGRSLTLNQRCGCNFLFFCQCSQQSVVNAKPESVEETEEEKEQKHKTFVEKYEKQIKHFGKYR